MKKLVLIFFMGVFVLSANSQIIVPLILPDNCNNPVNKVDIQSDESKPDLSLFPNPNDGTFTLKLKSPKTIENVEIVIYNSLGVECYLQKAYCNSKNLIRLVEVSDLSPGVYSLKVHSKTFDLNKSLVIRK